MDNNELLLAIENILDKKLEQMVADKIEPMLNAKLEPIIEKLDFVAEVLEGTIEMHSDLEQRVKKIEDLVS